MCNTSYRYGVEFDGDEGRREVLMQLTDQAVVASGLGLERAAAPGIGVC